MPSRYKRNISRAAVEYEACNGSVKIEDLSTSIQTALSIPTCLHQAGQWFLHSGIQEESGGVARYYRIDLGRNARLSTEITGYAISAFCYLYRQTDDPEYLKAAVRAGDFLVDKCWDAGKRIFPFEWPKTEVAEENRAFFFDCGIIIRGLLALYRLTNAEKYLAYARQCGHGMARAFENNGDYAPILQLPSGRALTYGNTWSNQPGCYQLKSAWGWNELHRETGDYAFAQYFETALQRALANGPLFLPGTPERQRVMDRLHSFSYFLEALLSVSNRAECAEALRSGIDQAGEYLRNIAGEFCRSDVYAQVLRVRLFAAAQGVVPLDEKAAREEAEAIPQFQFHSTDSRLNGGYCFGRRDGALTSYANPVSTAFCLQALQMWENWRKEQMRDTWQDLI